MHFLLEFFGRAPIWSSIEAVEYRGTTVQYYAPNMSDLSAVVLQMIVLRSTKVTG